MDAKKYVANRPFGYAPDVDLDRGQLFELRSLRNDEKLVRLGYCAVASKNVTPAVCSECGAEFVGDSERAAHGSERHRVRQLSPAEEEARLDRRERMLQEVAPLKIENSAANRS